MKEYESFARIGTEPHRSYYIPFAETDTIRIKHGIQDRTSSSRFTSLDGVWQIRQHAHVDDFAIDEKLDEAIPVPACVQMHGYDHIQYLNTRYPFPVMLPHLPYENPCWHYRRTFNLRKQAGEKYYLNFEGVDSAFYLYINGKCKGYSQISHATSEFDITDLAVNGENTIDVLVLKWCISTYLECQDKFRFSGIFRNVYILTRPENHITDYKLETSIEGKNGLLTVINESSVDIRCKIADTEAVVKVGSSIGLCVENIRPWTPEDPKLYVLYLIANGELIEEKIGFREVSIDGEVFKVNGVPVKLKGVNRHDFNCETAATVSLEDMAKDIHLMKELNVNAVRTSHYPNSPEFYLLCDKFGIYVMDEADLETHGACTRDGRYDIPLWEEYAENDFFTPGITDRHTALVERDKNRTSVIIWSLGNESSFGKAFFKGANYIKNRDRTRPVHYEGLQNADPKYYYTELVDMVSMMYPSFDTIREKVLDNPKENYPDYTTPVQEAIWNAATDLVPLNVTLPMIPAEYHESCTQWHTYLTDLLNDMYIHTDEYLAVSDLQTYIRWFWIWLYKWYTFESGTFFASPAVHKKFVKKMGAPLLDFLCGKWGFHVETTEAEVRLTNRKYPLLLTAVHDILAAAYENYNVNCGDYLTFCDCRALVNYKRTYHDMIVLLNREGRAMAETICEYAIANGIKPAKCTYFNRVEFKKKGKIVFVLDVAKGKDLKISIGFAEPGGPAFAKIAEAVNGYEDKAEFAKFWRQNLKKCTACNPDCQKRITPVEVFGLNCIVCQAYLRMFQPKKEDLKYIYRLISLRAMVIDAGVSEPFYPGNG